MTGRNDTCHWVQSRFVGKILSLGCWEGSWYVFCWTVWAGRAGPGPLAAQCAAFREVASVSGPVGSDHHPHLRFLNVQNLLSRPLTAGLFMPLFQTCSLLSTPSAQVHPCRPREVTNNRRYSEDRSLHYLSSAWSYFDTNPRTLFLCFEQQYLKHFELLLSVLWCSVHWLRYL